MFETSLEKQEDSPLQSLLEGAFLLLRFDKILKELDPPEKENPSNRDDVQGAVNADN
jgi:hypothetical protein